MLINIIKHNNVCILDPGCFPSTAKVNLKDGKVVTMSELKIGDQVKTGTDIGVIKFIILYY